MTDGTAQTTPANIIDGEVHELPSGAPGVTSINPAHPERTIWSACTPVEAVDQAVVAAREAFWKWRDWGAENRARALTRFAELVHEHKHSLADTICDETGKVLWEALAEAGAVADKVGITLEQTEFSGRHRVTEYDVPLTGSRAGRCLFRPHGVLAVLGPFNFPAHLPNGHIVPALLTGNTVVFKPSDKAPAVGQLLASLYVRALKDTGAPDDGRGVVNLVHGAGDVAKALADHDGIDGILFTGSWPVGRSILQANLDRPGRIVALEMGGNNPAVVLPDCDVKQAAIEIVRCAFNTAGQRCTCTRRAIIHKDIVDTLLPVIQRITSQLIIADPRADHPVFMGPVIRESSLDGTLAFQSDLASGGAEILTRATRLDPAGSGGFYVSPCIALVPRFTRSTDGPSRDAGCDAELFGPLLRVSIADSFDDALEQANATRYGLAASLFSRERAVIDRFLSECRAGCLNINTGTAGASSKLPFGGLGASGNHRPAGAFSLDYTAYPVASMQESGDVATLSQGMTFEESWIR